MSRLEDWGQADEGGIVTVFETPTGEAFVSVSGRRYRVGPTWTLLAVQWRERTGGEL